MKPAKADLPVVVQKAYEFNLWMIQKVENFPRSYRFSVGARRFRFHSVVPVSLGTATT